MKKKKLKNPSFAFPLIVLGLLVGTMAIGIGLSIIQPSSWFYDAYKTDEFTFYLPKLGDFEFYQDENYDYCLVGNDLMLTIIVDEKSFFQQHQVTVLDLWTYSVTIAHHNQADIETIKKQEDYYTFETQQTVNQVEYYLLVGCYQSEKNFYLFTFTCLKEDEDILKKKMERYLGFVDIHESEDETLNRIKED